MVIYFSERLYQQYLYEPFRLMRYRDKHSMIIFILFWILLCDTLKT